MLGKKKLIDLASLKWVQSNNGGECRFRDEPEGCDKLQKGNNCASSLWRHCCKHVLRAPERERTAFFQAVKTNADDPGPQSVGKIFTAYWNMAEKTIPNTSPFVGLSKSGQDIRMFCSSELNGVVMTDYVQLPPPPESGRNDTGNSQEDEKYKKKSELSIVSMYHSDYGFDGAWLLHCCHQLYRENKKEIPDMRVDPVISLDNGAGGTRECKVNFPLPDAAMNYAGFFYDPVPADPTLGAVAYFVAHKLADMKDDICDIAREIHLPLPSVRDELNSLVNEGKLKAFNPMQDPHHSDIYRKVVYSRVSYGWYAVFRYISQVMKEPLQWGTGLGGDCKLDNWLAFMDLRKNPYYDDDALLLFYILLAERFQLEKLLESQKNGDNTLLQRLKEGEEDNQVFYSTGYTIASSYARYRMALACLFCYSSPWKHIARKEYGTIGCKLCENIEGMKLESLEYWLGVFEDVFRLKTTVKKLSKESTKI
jgi:hypothetical protein